MTTQLRTLAAALILALLGACATTTSSPGAETATAASGENCRFNAKCFDGPPAYNPTPQETELDNIYTLLAYAVVYKNWQAADQDFNARGYNIGSVLVDEQKNVVCWGVNSNLITRNYTQHGEVRLMTNYLGNTQKRTLAKYLVYTTLEPCAMCSGMMTLQSVQRTVYGQRDPDFGDAIERLTYNSKPNGYCPYPRGVISVEAQNDITAAIDQAYCRYYNATPSPSLTRWLASEEARAFYQRANERLSSYKPVYPANQRYLDAARKFLVGVPSTFTPIPYTQNCN